MINEKTEGISRDVQEYILISFIDDEVLLDVKCTEKQCVLALIQVGSYLNEDSLYVLQDSLNKMWRGKRRIVGTTN